MNEAERDELLAGYLGDELTEPDRARFEAMMADAPELAAEVASLRRTIAAMRSLDAPGSGRAPGSGLGAAPAPVMRPLRMWMGAVLRYAAVIGLAFAAGYFIAGGGPEEPLAGRSMTPYVEGRVSELVLPALPGESEWLQRAAEVYITRQRGSSFARSLVAIAKAGEDKSGP